MSNVECGTVAMVLEGNEYRLAISTGEYWHIPIENSWVTRHVDLAVTQTAVAINPASVDDVNRLARLYRQQTGRRLDVNELIEALYRYADGETGLIDEPQGLGAIVRDTGDDLWHRINPDMPGKEWMDVDGHYAAWADISVVNTDQIVFEGLDSLDKIIVEGLADE